MNTRSILRPVAFAVLLGLAPQTFAGGKEKERNEASVAVEASRSSAFIRLDITSFRRIGKVLIEVKDLNGLTLYQERGKALTPELVRRFDKNTFPKGPLTLTVTARDFAITQQFIVE